MSRLATEIYDRGIPYRLPRSARVIIGSCFHFGASCMSEEGIRKFFERARRYPWISLGDMNECITLADGRSSLSDGEKQSVTDSRLEAVSFVKPAAGKCIALLRGNHEETLASIGIDVTKETATEAGVNFFGNEAAVVFHDIDGNKLNTYFTHGHYRFGNSTGKAYRDDANRKESLRNALSAMKAFDAIFVGHGHIPIVAEPLSSIGRVMNAETLKWDRIQNDVYNGWCGMAPSLYDAYLPGRSCYAKRRGLRQQPLGWLELVIENCVIKYIQHIDETGEVYREYRPFKM